MLSDRTIRRLIARGELGCDPEPPDEAYQPASLELCLGRSITRVREEGHSRIPNIPGEAIAMYPGECWLGHSVETIRIPPYLAARCEGKSSWGRKFLSIHSTAGFIDPGFEGQITFELKNEGPQKLWIPFDRPICQLSFEYLDTNCDRPYGSSGLGSHYQGQAGPTLSAIVDR